MRAACRPASVRYTAVPSKLPILSHDNARHSSRLGICISAREYGGTEYGEVPVFRVVANTPEHQPDNVPLKDLTATLGVPADALDFDAVTAVQSPGSSTTSNKNATTPTRTRNARLTAIRAVLGRPTGTPGCPSSGS
jgi:hypothetical protein